MNAFHDHHSRVKDIPMSEAALGDIIIASGGRRAAGYAGIVVDHGRIVRNGNHGVRNDSSFVEMRRSRQE